MYLTDDQIAWVVLIRKGVITDIYSFLDSLKEVSRCEYHGPNAEFELENPTEKGPETVKIPKVIYIYNRENFDLVTRKLFDFRFLTLFLEEQRLIKSIRLNKSRNCFFTPVICEEKRENIEFEDISDIINQFVFDGYKYRFRVSPAINEFIERGYKSVDMFYLEEENRDRKKAQQLTRRVAYVSISITAIVALSSTIFNLFTYNNVNEVLIKNQIDTNKVLIINPESIKTESSNEDSTSVNSPK
jgi:hypothetical protein